MKNIYVALGINNNGIIEIKGGCTKGPARNRLSSFHGYNTRWNRELKVWEKTSLDKDSIIYEKPAKRFSEREQRIINTVRYASEQFKKQGFAVKVWNVDDLRGNPAPYVKGIDTQVLRVIKDAFQKVKEKHLEKWESKESIWMEHHSKAQEQLLARYNALTLAISNRKLIQEKFKLSLTEA